MRPAQLALALLAAALAAGCGGAEREEEAAAPVPDYGRLSGTSVYASVAQLERGWKTDFSRHTVPLRQFQRGGPGRDGIAAVDEPWVVPIDEVDFLEDDEPVLEVVAGGAARAYPLGILLLHEIVNDRVGGVPVVVTFCPLCNTALAFERRVRGRTLSFASTGNLRNSDLVMYDRETESWWQQLGGEALVGRLAGAELRTVPARGVSWAQFRREHPDGAVATTREDFGFQYGENPYLGTLDPSRPPPFPVANANDRRLPPSERVVFVQRGEDAVVVPFSVLEAERELTVEVAGAALTVRLNGRTAEVRDGQGRLQPFSEPFWFAVAAFRPRVHVEE